MCFKNEPDMLKTIFFNIYVVKSLLLIVRCILLHQCYLISAKRRSDFF